MRFGIPVVALRLLLGAVSLAPSSAGFCQADGAVQQVDVFQSGIRARIAPGPLPDHLAYGSALGGSRIHSAGPASPTRHGRSII